MAMSNNTKGILLALLCTAIVSIAQILLKKGSVQFSLSPAQLLHQLSNYPLLIGGMLYVFGAIVFIYAFRMGELSLIYPVMASGYVIVTVLSIFFLKEEVTILKWGGMFLIMIGVVLIGRHGQNQSPPQKQSEATINNPSSSNRSTSGDDQ